MPRASFEASPTVPSSDTDAGAALRGGGEWEWRTFPVAVRGKSGSVEIHRDVLLLVALLLVGDYGSADIIAL